MYQKPRGIVAFLTMRDGPVPTETETLRPRLGINRGVFNKYSQVSGSLCHFLSIGPLYLFSMRVGRVLIN
jgi:hypothetical protein